MLQANQLLQQPRATAGYAKGRLIIFFTIYHIKNKVGVTFTPPRPLKSSGRFLACRRQKQMVLQKGEGKLLASFPSLTRHSVVTITEQVMEMEQKR